MHRYKLAVHILIILSVNFVPVLATPVPVQEVRKAFADVADGGEDVIIVSGKRADEGQGPWPGLTQASSSSESEPDYLSTSLKLPPGSTSTSDHASGVHQETTNPIQLPSSASGEMRRPLYATGGTELPWYASGEMRRPSYASGGTKLPSYASGGAELSSSSSGEMRRPPYANGGTELPWYSSDDTERLLAPGRGKVQQVQPGTTSKITSASSVRTKTNKWKALSSVRTKTDKWVPTTDIEPASSSSGEITPTSSSEVLPPSEQEEYLTQTPTTQPKPQSKSFLSDLSDLASKSKFRPRISATADGAVNAAQRELQGTVHTEAVTL